MPIRYRVDEGQGLVLTTIEGVVTAEDLASHGAALATDPKARHCDEIADLKHVVAPATTTDAVRRMAATLRERDSNRPGGKFAIVAPSDAAYGMARLYQAHREHPDIEIRAFRARTEALRWLGVDQDP